jgi:2-phosphosulfolactate phosphatase
MIDDTACAGLMVDIVRDRVENVDLNDGGKIALAVWEYYDKNMLEAFKDAEHAQSLRALGLWSDVEYAALQDESKIVPKLAIWQGLKAVVT